MGSRDPKRGSSIEDRNTSTPHPASQTDGESSAQRGFRTRCFQGGGGASARQRIGPSSKSAKAEGSFPGQNGEKRSQGPVLGGRDHQRNRGATITAINQEVRSIQGDDPAVAYQFAHPNDASVREIHATVFIFAQQL